LKWQIWKCFFNTIQLAYTRGCWCGCPGMRTLRTLKQGWIKLIIGTNTTSYLAKCGKNSERPFLGLFGTLWSTNYNWFVHLPFCPSVCLHACKSARIAE
jgi:hypothetical protein